MTLVPVGTLHPSRAMWVCICQPQPAFLTAGVHSSGLSFKAADFADFPHQFTSSTKYAFTVGVSWLLPLKSQYLLTLASHTAES